MEGITPTGIAPWVRQIHEDITGGSPFNIGDIVETDTGKTIKIVDGQYWGTYGISNFWWWKEVLSTGELGQITYCGYGRLTDKGKLVTKDNQREAR